MINTEKYLVIDGGTVKTDENGLVTGMGIVFGSEKETDQSKERDFFTSDTFVRKSKSFSIPLYYKHAIGSIRDEIGEAVLTKQKEGWSVEAKLDLDDPNAQKVYEAVKANQHGFSTGALPHMVVREQKSNGSHFIKKWVPGEISLTPQPAERRAIVQYVKSLDDELVYTPIEDETPTTVAFYNEDGSQVWEVASGEPMPDWVQDTKENKKIEVKGVGGSVNYNIYMYDEESGRSADISVYEYGGVEDFLNRVSQLVDTAKSSISAESSVEMPSWTTKDFKTQVEGIVKPMLKESEDEISTLKTQLEEKEKELVALKETFAASETALADLKREQFEKTLAGAEDTINKNKGK